MASNISAGRTTLDRAGVRPQPAPRPQPEPPPEARPKRLFSVTEIEDWLRDPYTIYAKHVLRLLPLEAVDTPPGAADRGSVIHEAIGEFTKKFADNCRTIPSVSLLALGETSFAPLEGLPGSTGVLVAALPAHCGLVHWHGSASGGRRSTSDPWRNFRTNWRSRSATPNSPSRRAPTASSGGTTAATPLSTTRPGNRRPSRQVRERTCRRN